MRIGGASRCCLAVILSAYALLAGTEARATDNASNNGAFGGASAVALAGTGGSAGDSASALSSANAFSGAFPGTASFPGAHDGHKGVRSYDNTDYSYANDASKSYDTPWGQHGTGQHGTRQHGTKGGDRRDNNKDGCSKCKWENDDYWERDEPEEEGDENDGDECDDGQYRPDKTHHHHGASEPGRGHASGSRPLDVHKTGPTGVYDSQGAVKGGKLNGLVSDTGYPANVVYAGTTSGFGTTPRPGSGWDSSPFAGTSKPEYDSATVRIHGTTPTGLPWSHRSTPRPSWGDGHGFTSPGSLGGSTPRPSWSNDGFANTPTTGYPTSHNPASSWHANQDNTFVGSYGSTPRPTSSWNTGPTGAPTGGYSSSSKPAASWNVGHDSGFPTAGYPSSQKTPGWSSDNTPVGSYGSTPRPPPGWSSIPTVAPITGFSSSPKPDAPWSTGHDNTPAGSFGTTPTLGQPWSADFSGKPQSNWSPDHGITGSGDAPGCTQSDISCDQEKQVPVKVSAILTSFDDRKEPLTSSGAPRGSDGAFPPSSGSSNWPYGQPGTQGTSGAYAGADATVGFGSTPHVGAPDFGKKTHPFFDKTTSVSRPYDSGPYGPDQSRTILGPSIYGPGGTFDHGKPRPHDAWSSSTTFGTTKGPQTGYSGVTRPNYGSGTTGTTSWPSIGSSAWPGSGTTGVHAGFPASNAGFGTTKSPFDHGSTPGLPSGPYSPATDTRRPGFNIASSSATANANAFATSFGAHSTPDTTERTPPRFTTPVYTESSSYPGVKSSSGSGRPIYGTTSHGVKSGIGSGDWPGGQPGSVRGTWPDQTQPSGGTGSWPRKQPGSGSGIAPGTDHPGVAGGTWPVGQTTSVPGTWHGAHSTKPDVGDGTWPGRQPGAVDGIAPAGQPGGASGTWPGSGSTTAPDIIHPGIGAGAWPGQQPGHGTGTWPGRQPGAVDGITPVGRPGGASGTWPGSGSTTAPDIIHPGIGAGAWPGQQPGHGTGIWPGRQPGTASGIAPARRPGGASGIWPGSSSTTSPNVIHPGIGGSTWPGQQPGHGIGTWPDGQTGQGSGIGCPNRNYNCAAGCSGSDGNTPATHAPCDGVTGGPSGVTKTYYPVGIGDGNVPSFTNAPASSFGSVTSGSAQWNPANPFLHGGGTPSDVSRPWGETTDKPIGQKNPFLDPNWSVSKPGLVGGNVNDDRNVIPLGGDTKPFNKENPFLNGDKGRGDIEIDSIEGVRPLEDRRPEENNPFIGSSGRENAGPGIPSYAGHPIGSSGSSPSGSGGYGGVKGGGPYPRVPSHGNIDGSYPTRGSVQGGAGPLQCKLGLFGCGTPGSGSYATTKGDKYPVGTYPGGGGIGGNVGTTGAAPAGVGGGIGIGAASGSYAGGFGGSGAGYPGSAGGDPAGPTGAGGRVGTYGSSFSSALASSSSFAGAKSVSSATGSAGADNNFGPLDSGNWSSGGTRNQGGPDGSWASSGASAFASSSSGNWSGNRPPIDVKG